MIVDILQIATTLLLAATKFFAGMIVLVSRPIGLLPSFLVSIGGGVVGIIIFTYFGAIIRSWFERTFPNATGKTFTRKNRFLVRLRRSFGIPGIAVLTPVLLSIPIGVFLALTLTRDKERIMRAMVISTIFWSCAILLPYYLFDVDVRSLFAGLF